MLGTHDLPAFLLASFLLWITTRFAPVEFEFAVVPKLSSKLALAKITSPSLMASTSWPQA